MDGLCYKLRGSAWAVGSCRIGPLAKGIFQNVIFKTLRQTGKNTLDVLIGDEVNSPFLKPRLDEFVPGVTRPDVAPRAVRLQHEPFRRNRLEHCQILLGF